MERVYTLIMHITLYVDKGKRCVGFVDCEGEQEEQCNDGEELVGLNFPSGIRVLVSDVF